MSNNVLQDTRVQHAILTLVLLLGILAGVLFGLNVSEPNEYRAPGCVTKVEYHVA